MFLKVLDFLLSPLGVPIYFGIFGVLPLVLIARRSAKRYAILRSHFQGSYSWLHGLRFNSEGYLFRLSAEGRASGSVEYGGISSRPFLWGYVDSSATFFCGGSEIQKYAFSWNLGPSPHQKRISFSGKELIIGSNSEEFLLQVERIFAQEETLFKRVNELLETPGSYIAVRPEIHIGAGSIISKKNTFRYYGFPPALYTDTSILEKCIKNITIIFERVNIVLEQSKK